MKHVSILLLHHVNLAGLENARQGLMQANEFLANQGKPEAFEIELVGLSSAVKLENGLYAVQADQVIQDVEATDIIIIPPLRGDIGEAMKANTEFCPWISTQYKRGAEVVSLCLGTFILGNTGLLNGKSCVTHWRAAQQFKNLFPAIRLMPDRLLTDEGGIYTGGGAFSSANLILYLIEKHVNREAAVYCSKIFQIDMGRSSQTPFIIFSGQNDHQDNAVKTAQQYIEENYAGRIAINDLCKRLALGRRTFERRFKKATQNTVSEYIQRVKIEAAKRALEKDLKTVSEVMFEVGYSDTQAFRKVFKKLTGLTPTSYKERFRQKFPA